MTVEHKRNSWNEFANKPQPVVEVGRGCIKTRILPPPIKEWKKQQCLIWSRPTTQPPASNDCSSTANHWAVYGLKNNQLTATIMIHSDMITASQNNKKNELSWLWSTPYQSKDPSPIIARSFHRQRWEVMLFKLCNAFWNNN